MNLEQYEKMLPDAPFLIQALFFLVTDGGWVWKSHERLAGWRGRVAVFERPGVDGCLLLIGSVLGKGWSYSFVSGLEKSPGLVVHQLGITTNYNAIRHMTTRFLTRKLTDEIRPILDLESADSRTLIARKHALDAAEKMIHDAESTYLAAGFSEKEAKRITEEAFRLAWVR